ncbi:DUF2922 domain-containing protein [Desertibacillus haloalkaliphilus]|uniref:DUF2922 domain-containing protein n=1 Tax=Desertibacillus haloalkaliphilus TaxID=1328930 RepID=UPI001C27AE56|nr:DUF2922 domain-containing protein [Desertibacillus haloalkaliphilus]MBU8906507.1 DUF2922 domain-containing protein [Desertibacillus haloalkaliphilus]
MDKQIQLQFENVEGRTVTISLDDPIEPVDQETVRAAMDTIISEGAIASTRGDLVAKKSARIVGRTVEMVDISE